METCFIYLTGDLHGHLSDEAEARLAAARAEHENALLLDAGDAVEAGNLGTGKKDSPVLTRMSRLGYDAMAMGNRESHPFKKALEQKLYAAAFPILGANVMAKRQPLPKKVKSHIIKRLPNGLRIAIIGLAPQITAPESWWSRMTDYVFDKPEKTVEGLTAKLRSQVDLLVLLSHCGIAVDKKLAKIAGVDVVLGGHSHIELFDRNEGAPIFHTGFLGRKFGMLEVAVECEKIVNIEAKLETLSESPPPKRRTPKR